MARKQSPRFNPKTFLEKVSEGKATLMFPKKQIIFSQGDAAHWVFYIHEGQIKLSTLSQEGKEAVIAILDRGNFFGRRMSRRAADIHDHRDLSGTFHSRTH